MRLQVQLPSTNLNHVVLVVQQIVVEVREQEVALFLAALTLLHLAYETPHRQVIQVHLPSKERTGEGEG